MIDIVSVCIPVYNGAEYLRQCLESVVTQSYQAIEVLIVDDGSSDNSIAIAREFVTRDARIKLNLNSKNLGLVGNWQHCIELATGKWIKFLFQDDLMHPRCIEEMLYACQHNNTQVCICSREFIIEESAGEILKKFFSSQVYKLEEVYPYPTYISPKTISSIAASNLFNNVTGEPIALLFDKNLIQAYGTYNEDLVQLVDYEFALRLSLNVGFYFLPQKLVSFRVHSNSESSNQSSTSLKKLKNQFVEPLLMYHEYLFNPKFKRLRKSYDITAKKMLKDALYFYKYHFKENALPNSMKRYLFQKYKGLYLISLGRFIPNK